MNVNLLLTYLKGLKKHRNLERLPIAARMLDSKDTVESRLQKKDPLSFRRQKCFGKSYHD